MTAAVMTNTPMMTGKGGTVETAPTRTTQQRTETMIVKGFPGAVPRALNCQWFLKGAARIDKSSLAWRSLLSLDAFQKRLRQVSLDLVL